MGTIWAILPDRVRRFQPTRLSVPTSTYHLVACLVGTGSAVLVDQITDGSLCRSAILRGYGTGVTQRLLLATRT